MHEFAMHRGIHEPVLVNVVVLSGLKIRYMRMWVRGL